MAEVVGVVASGIAVSQAAQTVGGAVLSLSRLWSEVKDVPETIQDILDELELAGKLVTAIEDELNSSAPSAWPSGSTSVPSIQCFAIQRCRQVHKDLGDLVDDLAADIASSRRRKRLVAKTRVVLKKEILGSYERRLQKALRFLDSAVQLQLASSIKRQPGLIAAEITNALSLKNLSPAVREGPGSSAEEETRNPEDMTEGLPPIRTTHQELARRVRRKPHPKARRFSRWGIEWTEIEEQSDRPFKTKSYRVRISCLKWLLSQAWELQASMACSGWSFHLRQWVVVPSDSEVFRTIERGTFQELRELFDKGLASPFSMDENGVTLLNRASCRQWSLVEPLLQMGLDFSAEDASGHAARCLYHGACMRGFTGAQEADPHRVMLSSGVYDELSASTTTLARTVLTELVLLQMISSVELFQSFHTHVFPNFYQWPLEDRIAMLGFLPPLFSTLDRRAVALYFHPDGRYCPEHLQVQYRQRDTEQTALYLFASWYFEPKIAWQTTAEISVAARRWLQFRPIIRDMVSVIESSDLSAATAGNTVLAHGVLSWRTSMVALPWIFLTYKKGHHWKACLRENVRAWAEDIRIAGHDLVLYGKSEMAAFHRYDGLDLLDWPPRLQGVKGSVEGSWRWRGFNYGPEPDDWDLVWEWDPAVEEFVGDFWSWIENPPLSIPGAWVDDGEVW